MPIRSGTAGGMVLALAVGAGGFLLLGLFWQLLRQPGPVALASRVEQHHPEFKDGLICAVELEDKTDADLNPVEQALRSRVLAQFQSIDLVPAILPDRLSGRRLLIEALLAVVVAVLAMQVPIWDKALYAWGFDAQPALLVVPGDAELPRGSDLPVAARIFRWEETAVVEMDSGSERLSYEMHPAQDGYSFTFYGVSTPFRYRVLSPSLASPWYRVATFLPPDILQVQMELVPPAYTGEPAVIVDELGDQSVLEGTSVRLFVGMNVPADAWLETDDRQLPLQPDADEPLLSRRSFKVEKDMTFRIGMRDAAGRENRSREMTLSVFPDAVPDIEVLSPEAEAVVPPAGSVFFQARAIDDYGMQNVQLHLSVAGRLTQSYSLYEGGGDEDVLAQQQLLLKDLGVRPGEVIAYYFTAVDEKTPDPQTGRSDIRFVEVRPEIKPREMPGEGQEMQSVDVNRIIAELRRLIRLSYDVASEETPGEERVLEVVTGLSDLRTVIVEQMDKVKEQGTPGDGSDILIAWFQRGLADVEQATSFARIRTFAAAIQAEERALSTFTRLAQELMKNQSSKSSSEGKSGQGQPSEEQQKKESGKQISLAEALEQLKDMQRRMRHLADRQGAQNQRVSRSQAASDAERQELSAAQNELAEKTGELQKDIGASGFLRELSEQVGNAQSAMKEATGRLGKGDMAGGGRSGERAQRELLAAVEKADQVARQIAARQIGELARQFGQLAEAEGKLSEYSKQAAAKDQVDKKTRDAMRNAQKKVGDKTEDVLKNAEAVTRELQDVFPEAGDALEEAIRKAAAENLGASMKKAENALLYGRMERASGYQKEAAENMLALAQNISLAGDKLPAISSSELLKALAQMKQASIQAKSGQEGARPSAEAAAEIMNRIGRQLNDLQLMQLSGQLGGLLDNESGPRAMRGAAVVLDQSVELLQRHLMRLQIDKREELSRKLAQPPPKYRRQVEEYFKELSEEE